MAEAGAQEVDDGLDEVALEVVRKGRVFFEALAERGAFEECRPEDVVDGGAHLGELAREHVVAEAARELRAELLLSQLAEPLQVAAFAEPGLSDDPEEAWLRLGQCGLQRLAAALLFVAAADEAGGGRVVGASALDAERRGRDRGAEDGAVTRRRVRGGHGLARVAEAEVARGEAGFDIGRIGLGDGLLVGHRGEDLLELLAHEGGRGGAVLATLGEHEVDDARETRVELEPGGGFGEWFWLCVNVFVEELERVVLVEGDLARQHLVEEDSERVDVRAGVDGLGVGLLGAHITRGPKDRARLGERELAVGVEELGDAEVEDLDEVRLARALAEEDVLGLEIAVDDAATVGFFEASTHLDRDADREAWGDATVDREAVAKGAALEQLHREIEAAALGLAEVENGDGVWVLEPARGADLPEETLHRGLVAVGPVVHDLDGDVAVHRVLARHVDRPHATFAEQSSDRVAVVDDRAGGETRAEVHESRAVVRTAAVAAREHAFALGTEEFCDDGLSLQRPSHPPDWRVPPSGDVARARRRRSLTAWSRRGKSTPARDGGRTGATNPRGVGEGALGRAASLRRGDKRA